MTPRPDHLPPPGCQKWVISPRVLPAISSDFCQKPVKTPMFCPGKSQKCAENGEFRHISANLFGREAGFSARVPENTVFFGF